MREIGRAEANRNDRAEAAARLQRATAEGWVPSRSAAGLPDLVKEGLFPEKTLYADKNDLPDERVLSVQPAHKWTKESDRPSSSAVNPKPWGSTEAKTEARSDTPSARSLIDKVLENPRRTREELRDCLALVSDLHVEAAAREVEVVDAAREVRMSWAEIAVAQHLSSRQAAEQRYRRLKEGISSLLNATTDDSGKSPS